MKALQISILITSLSFVAFMAQASSKMTNQTETSIRPNPKAFSNAKTLNQVNRPGQQRSAAKNKGSAQTNKTGSYSTSHSFEGSKIQGQLQEGSLRRIMVENDKSIDDLLGIRKQFDDRELEETERNLSW